MPKQALAQCIEVLYNTFASYALSATFGDCPQWLNTATVKAIREKPLRELTAQDLERYANHVTYCGTEDDFRYLLPRILELFAMGSLVTEPATPDILFLNLSSDKWSEAEGNAIRDYIMALWDTFLNDDTFELGADEFLCHVAVIFPDLHVFLDSWDAQESVSSLRQLAAFTHDVSYAGCWRWHPTQLQQVLAWLFRPSTIQKLAMAFDNYIDEPFAKEFYDATLILNEWDDQFRG